MTVLFASEASAVTNCANLRFLVYIFIYLFASEASAVTNCANLRFLVYILFIYRVFIASEASLMYELAGAILWYIS